MSLAGLAPLSILNCVDRYLVEPILGRSIMLRFVLACCLSLIAADALAVTISWNCAFGIGNPVSPPMAPYTAGQAAQLANAVLCSETSKSTATEKRWQGTGPNGCIYTIACTELANGSYNWGCAIADARGFCIVQSGIVNGSGTTAGGPVKGSDITNQAWFSASAGTFTVSP